MTKQTKIFQEINPAWIGMWAVSYEDARGVKQYALGVVDDFGNIAVIH